MHAYGVHISVNTIQYVTVQNVHLSKNVVEKYSIELIQWGLIFKIVKSKIMVKTDFNSDAPFGSNNSLKFLKSLRRKKDLPALSVVCSSATTLWSSSKVPMSSFVCRHRIPSTFQNIKYRRVECSIGRISIFQNDKVSRERERESKYSACLIWCIRFG